MTWLQQVRRLVLHPNNSTLVNDPTIHIDEAESSRASPETGNLLPSGSFAANYWATGEMMRVLPNPDSQSSSWLPENSIRDTAFQILKVAGFTRLSEGNRHGSRQDLRYLLNDIRVPWLYELDDRDCRRVYAWPHSQDDGINTFRLDDHYWVWRAVKSMEVPSDNISEPQSPEADRWICFLEGIRETNKQHLREARERFSATMKRLHSTKVQRGILQNFTAENEVSEQRMLAVTRSPRETRFLLHARDSALFYDNENFIHSDATYKALWRKTIESQVLLPENEDEIWHKTLRHALVILIATSGLKPNKHGSNNPIRNATKVLRKVTGHSGLIHGELDIENYRPMLFTNEEDRDSYYHSSFEIPYILLKCGRHIDEAHGQTAARIDGEMQLRKLYPGIAQPEKPFAIEDAPGLAVDPSQRHFSHTRLEGRAIDPLGNLSNFARVQMLTLGYLRNAPHKAQFMKKAMPFSSNMDVSNIVDMTEEWLYAYPAFLMTKDRGLPENEVKTFDEQISQNENTSHVVAEGARRYRSPHELRKNQGFASNAVTFVADAPKQKSRGKRHKKRQDDPISARPRDNNDLWAVIGKRRTAEIAKKRFIWLPHPNPETAYLCWLSSTEDERPRIDQFFNRHFRCRQHFWESTSMSRNIWRTELHLSFYALVCKDAPRHVGIPEQEPIEFPSHSVELRRASMGFRFDGDMFDRYWTCHFIQYLPSLKAPKFPRRRDPKGHYVDSSTNPAQAWDFDFNENALGRFKEKHWWQRKVLELYLLRRILGQVMKDSDEIMREVEGELGVKNRTATLPTLNSEAYASSKDRWREFERVLNDMEEEYTAMLNVLEHWNSRERDRAPEDPRWTRNDEKKYRSHVNRFRSSQERQVLRLARQRDRVRKLRHSLDTSIEKIQTDLELQREQHIRLFTYVTVIFLPLGFAASFYSMVCAPSDMKRKVMMMLTLIAEWKTKSRPDHVAGQVCRRRLRGDSFPATLRQNGLRAATLGRRPNSQTMQKIREVVRAIDARTVRAHQAKQLAGQERRARSASPRRRTGETPKIQWKHPATTAA